MNLLQNNLQFKILLINLIILTYITFFQFSREWCLNFLFNCFTFYKERPTVRVCKLPNWYMSWYNSQKLHKIRYQSFLGHVNYIRCLCFVPNTLSKIVGPRFILGLKVILDPRVGVLWTPLGFQSSKCHGPF